MEIKKYSMQKVYERGFIDNLDFKVNDKKIKWNIIPNILIFVN